ncbi:MAG: metallophosphoesterase family protein [Candidatus Dojkabacteria bacterium]|nr:metallophosphoesterase family protein [Candidatus Dojkabacteria bacterium]
MILVLSDTHLGKYDKKKDTFLKNLVKDYNNIIINGDFWDSWATSFKDFINSEYKELFELLKSKNTIYIYGNHDYRAEYDKKSGDTFSNFQGIEYDTKIGNRDFHFEHGHRYFFNTKNPLFVNYYYIIDKIPFLGPMTNNITELTYKVFPSKVGKNKISTKRNSYVKEIKAKDIYYVMSHTHIPDIDEENKYINTGCIVGNFLSYVVIDNQGNPLLIRNISS